MISLTVRVPPWASAALTFATYWLAVVWLTVALEAALVTAARAARVTVPAAAARFALSEIVTEVAARTQEQPGPPWSARARSAPLAGHSAGGAVRPER